MEDWAQRTVQHLSRGQGWRLCECLAEELGFILYNRAPYLVLKKERRLLWLPVCIQLHLPDPAVWVWIPLLLLGNGMALGKSDAINMWMKLRMTSMSVLLWSGIEVVKAHRAEGQQLRSHDGRGTGVWGQQDHLVAFVLLLSSYKVVACDFPTQTLPQLSD